MTVDAGFSLRARKQVKDHLKTSDYTAFNLLAGGNYSKLSIGFPQFCIIKVCSGSSGHTEAVQMLFNPDLVCFSFFNKHPPPCFWDFFKAYLVVKIVVNIFQVTYKELLMVLFDRMDPTTLNR